jgi:RNA polymerase sigma-70 factor (ECF subfamily)
MSPHLDAEQVARLRARDPATLARAVEEHARPLYRAARGMGFDEAEAEDLVQDVFTTFLETLDRFEGRSQVRTWLFGIP